MIPFIIILAILLLIFLILAQWIKLHISADEGVTVKIGVGPIMFDATKASPGKKKKIKKGKKKKGAKDSTEEKSSPKEPEKKDGPLKTVSEIIEIVKEILPKANKKFHLRARTIEIKVATGDAASTAIVCGAAKAAASLLFELIDTYAVIDKGKSDRVTIEPDFLSEKSTCKVDLRFRVRVIHALGLFMKTVLLFVKKKANN